MAALKRITSVTKALTTALNTASRPCCLQTWKKTYFTYVNEPSMPIPGKEPCWVSSAEEAMKSVELDSG